MAGKSGTKSNPAAPFDRVLDQVLALSAAHGWRRLTMADLARASGLSLAELRTLFPGGRAHILASLMRRVDARVMVGDDPTLSGESPRDRLFDVMMRRFDAMLADGPGLRAVIRDLPRDPAATALSGPQVLTSMAWMLEAAGLSAAGLKGALRVQGLAAIHLRLLCVWAAEADEGATDLPRTMAALDRALGRAEKFEGLLCRCRSGPWNKGFASANSAPGNSAQTA